MRYKFQIPNLKCKKGKNFWFLALGSWFLLLCSCAYFNTFYNAQNYYRQAMKLVKHDTLKVDSEYFDKTIEKTTSVIIKYPNSRYVDDALFMMGASYYYKGDYSRALEKLEFLTLNYPESKFIDDALYIKGLAYYKQNKYGKAVVSLEEALQYSRFRTKSLIALCYVYNQNKDYSFLCETAEDLLEQRLNAQERRSLLYLYGEAQYQQGLYDNALETFNKLLSMTRSDNDKRDLKIKIAEIYLQLGEYEKCKNFLEGETDPEFLRILGDLHLKLGDLAKAKQLFYEAGMRSSLGDAAETYYKLAELYRAEDSLEIAVSLYDSASFKAPMSEHGIQAKKMANVLRRITTLSAESEDPDRAQFLLAEIYFIDFEEPERALDEYEKVHVEYPTSEWAPKALYAQLWITSQVLMNDSMALRLARTLFDRYPLSEYAESARNLVPLPSEKPEEEDE